MRHRTTIVQTSQTGPTVFLFRCNNCRPQDYQRTARSERKNAVDDARAHRFAYRAIEEAIIAEIKGEAVHDGW